LQKPFTTEVLARAVHQLLFEAPHANHPEA
jgi:hypothetical protein